MTGDQWRHSRGTVAESDDEGRETADHCRQVDGTADLRRADTGWRKTALGWCKHVFTRADRSESSNRKYQVYLNTFKHLRPVPVFTPPPHPFKTARNIKLQASFI